MLGWIKDRKTRKPGGGRVIEGVQRDPTQELRSKLARLEAQAMQLNSGGDLRVLRNLDSVCEVGRRMRQETSRYASGGDSQASVELFMASVGFNVQEQQRLLQQITAARASAVDDVPQATAGTGEAPEVGQPQDLDAFLARKRSEALMTAVNDVHRTIVERERDESEDFIAEIWERRKDDLATTLGMRNFSTFNSDTSLRGGIDGTTTLDGSVQGNGTGGLNGSLLSGADPHLPVIDARRINEFTRIVGTAPSSQWLSQSADVAWDDPKVHPAVKQNWVVVDRMLTPLINSRSGSRSSSYGGDGAEGSSSMTPGGDRSSASSRTVMTLVSSSRGVLEESYLRQLLQSTTNAREEQLHEYTRMPAKGLGDLIRDYCSTNLQASKDPTRPYARANPTWSECYIAMRCGRYDAAAKCAEGYGATDVAAALEGIHRAKCTPDSERKDPLWASNESNGALDGMWGSDETDPYRKAVLMILMAGRVPGVARNDDTEHKIREILDRVAHFPEDALWFRMCLVRRVQSDGSYPGHIQSLSTLQEQLNQSKDQLRSDPHKLINILLHALMPSTALRLLLQEEGCFLDAVQMAVIFDSINCLTCNKDVEKALDLDSILPRLGHYALNASRPTATGQVTAASGLFNYFWKTNRRKAFVNLCQDATVCARFFGRPDSSTREGELLQGSPPAELLETMFDIALDAQGKGKLKNAVHVLLVLASVAMSQRDTARSNDAMKGVLRCMNPALVHCVHPSQHNHHGRLEVLELTNAVRAQLNHYKADLTPDVDAFYQLCDMMRFHQALSIEGPTEQAIYPFLSLPFVPVGLVDVDEKARRFNTNTTEEVVAATPFALLAALRTIRVLYDSQSGASGYRARLKEQGQALLRWQAKWRIQLGSEQTQEIQAYHNVFSN